MGFYPPPRPRRPPLRSNPNPGTNRTSNPTSNAETFSEHNKGQTKEDRFGVVGCYRLRLWVPECRMVELLLNHALILESYSPNGIYPAVTNFQELHAGRFVHHFWTKQFFPCFLRIVILFINSYLDLGLRPRSMTYSLLEDESNTCRFQSVLNLEIFSSPSH